MLRIAAHGASLHGLALLVLLCACASARAADTPMDVLRTNVSRAIEVLEDPQYQAEGRRVAQRERLCEIAQEMFDPYLFGKLALGGGWERFSANERTRFIDTFADYLCRYYLTRLQRYYSDESVEYLRQTYRSPQIATVEAEVLWQDRRIPVKIRMALREGRWKAYDLVLLGVSAVLVYRSQFEGELRKRTPAELIEDLRTRALREP